VPPSSPARLALPRQEIADIPEYDGPIEEQPAEELAQVAVTQTVRAAADPPAAVVEPTGEPDVEAESFGAVASASRKQVFWFVASAVAVVLVGLAVLFARG
jgi:hypothetical protein